MVIFDIMVSHHRMLAWHERSIETHLAEMASLQRLRDAGEGEKPHAASAEEASSRREGAEGASEDGNPAAERVEAEAGPDSNGTLIAAEGAPLDRRWGFPIQKSSGQNLKVCLALLSTPRSGLITVTLRARAARKHMLYLCLGA
jgi:hypothetical protein